jgi:hypothetical protein
MLLTVLFTPFTIVALGDMINRGYDLYFREKHAVVMSEYRVTAYLAGLDDPAIVVRQERRIVPGLLLVRDIATICEASDAQITVVDANTIRVEVPGYGRQRPHRDKPIQLRRFVYF